MGRLSIVYRDLIKAVRAIIAFKAKLLRLLIQCKAEPGSNYPLLLDHIRREAEHFLNLLRTPVPEDPLSALLQEEVFWLRIMKEHIEFVIHLLDPSERELIKQAREFRKTFSRLLETARDLLGIISTPLLLDHIRREADKFLSELRVLLPEVIKCRSSLEERDQVCSD